MGEIADPKLELPPIVFRPARRLDPAMTRDLTSGSPGDLIGSTPHVTVYVSPSYGAAGQAIAKQCLAAAEIHYKRVAGFFGTPQFVPHVDFIIVRDPYSAGYHYVGINKVYANILTGYGWDYVSAIFVAELEELFGEPQGFGWSDMVDHGESMSRFIMSRVVPKTIGSIDRVALWWNNGAPDFVSKASHDYANGTATGGDNGIGCGFAFLCFLQKILGKTPNQMLAGPAPTLEAVYRHLTGKQGGYAAMMVEAKRRGLIPKKTQVGDNLFG